MTLQEILPSDESKTLEFKENTLSKERILACVVAFANSSGGKIIVGIEDQTKKIVGVDNPHLEEERLANLIYDSITPGIVFNIEILPCRQTHVLIVDVPMSGSRPHYIRKKGIESSCYVRVGSTNRIADEAMRGSIQKSLSFHSYDEEVCYGAAYNDIDVPFIQSAFAALRPLSESDLFSLGLVHKIDEHLIPSKGAILLFGNNRERFFPDAWLKAGCFEGEDKTKIIDNLDIHDFGVSWVERGMQFIRRHLKVGLIIEEVKHVEQWEIPQAALREALLNAVVHADYIIAGSPLRISIFDDRIEVENPGLLPSGLSLHDMKTGYSKVRNRVLARVFRDLKQTEQWGSGVQRIINLCTNAGLREPLFEEVVDRFRVTLFRYRINNPALSSLEEDIVKDLNNLGQASTSELARLRGMSEKSIRKRLSDLIEKGVVQEISKGLNDPRKKFVLISQARNLNSKI